MAWGLKSIIKESGGCAIAGREATIVTLWLSNSVNLRLESKLKRDLRPGTRIVSRQFPIGDWAPDQTVKIGDEILRLWIVPPR